MCFAGGNASPVGQRPVQSWTRCCRCYPRVCVRVCVCVCVRARARTGALGRRGWRGGYVCFWLMFVMLIAVFRESNLLQGVGEERRKSPASRREPSPHRTAQLSTVPSPRCVPGRDSESGRRRGRLGRVGTQPWRTLAS